MGNNLPPDVNPGSPRAPWNREPPPIERRAESVTLDVVIEVSEDAPDGRVRKEVPDAIGRGEYELVERKTMDVLDRWKP